MRRFVCLAVVCLAFAACGDATGPESVAGRYALISMNGTPLPFLVVQVLEEKVEVAAGHIQLNADGTCTAAFTFRVTADGEVTSNLEARTCTWTYNNPAIAFNFRILAAPTHHIDTRLISVVLSDRDVKRPSRPRPCGQHFPLRLLLRQIESPKVDHG